MSSTSKSSQGEKPNLSKMDFNNRDFYKTNFEGFNLAGSIFSGSNVAKANFARANLSDSKFANANVFSANFNGADLTGASFDGADLSKADLRNITYTRNPSFTHTTLKGAFIMEKDLPLFQGQVTEERLRTLNVEKRVRSSLSPRRPSRVAEEEVKVRVRRPSSPERSFRVVQEEEEERRRIRLRELEEEEERRRILLLRVVDDEEEERKRRELFMANFEKSTADSDSDSDSEERWYLDITLLFKSSVKDEFFGSKVVSSQIAENRRKSRFISDPYDGRIIFINPRNTRGSAEDGPILYYKFVYGDGDKAQDKLIEAIKLRLVPGAHLGGG